MIYSSPGPDPGYNPIAPIVGIVEPGFLPGFTWSQSGVFKEAAGRCTAATVYCIAGVISSVTTRLTMATRRKSTLWKHFTEVQGCWCNVLYYITLLFTTLFFIFINLAGSGSKII